MRLATLCEPLFQYVARAHRSALKGCGLPFEMVRADIQRLFDETGQEASTTANLASQYERIRLPLIFFVDFMMRDSNLNFQTEWVPLAYEVKEYAGDEKFFDILEADLEDSSEGATERLAVYYTCLGLGFTGLYVGEPDAIRRLMGRISGRISRFMDTDHKARICPQAYEHTDSRNFTEPPARKLVGIGIALVGLLIVWFVAYAYFFHSQRRSIKEKVDRILATPQSSVNSGASHVPGSDPS